MTRKLFTMRFDIGTIKHLGLQMYSTLPSVISELVANAWDADATKVEIAVPDGRVTDASEIIVRDNGVGMSGQQIQDEYLIVGRDRRKGGTNETSKRKRPLMGRKGIGKFAGFGIAQIIRVESAPEKGEASCFEMDYEYLDSLNESESAKFQKWSTNLDKGTRVILKNIMKFRDRAIGVQSLRRSLARRFSIIGAENNFSMIVNGEEITPDERDLQRYLDKDQDGDSYLWEYDDEPIDETGKLTVSGWIGALRRTDSVDDGVDRGIAIMARGKLVQSPFTFEAVVGQQFALSYLIGEIHAEFVDSQEDTIATSRNTLVWDVPANAKLMEWGKKQVNKIAREWAKRRGEQKQKMIEESPQYQVFVEKANATGNKRAKQIFDKLVRNAIQNATPDDDLKVNHMIKLATDYLEFDQFWAMAEEIRDTKIDDLNKIVNLFREWEIVEAKEMMRITEGRIETIKKFEDLINTGAKEVPVVHQFLKEFPWVLDPRWTLVSDETYYSKLLKEQFPESDTVPEINRRIDFLCIGEGQTLVVVEIKRPGEKMNKADLEQIEGYVQFLRGEIDKSSGERKYDFVVGYLMGSDIVGRDDVKQKQKTLANDRIYVKTYRDLLIMVEDSHREFLDRYKKLQEVKAKTA